jgi:hypothetical protein
MSCSTFSSNSHKIVHFGPELLDFLEQLARKGRFSHELLDYFQ